MKVIEYLKNSPAVEKVNHPSLPECGYKELYDKYFPNGAGSIFTFEIKGGEREAKEFIDRLELFLAFGKCCRCKIPCDPSCKYDTRSVKSSGA